MGTRPSHFNGANRPVEQVYRERADFCNKLSEMDGWNLVMCLIPRIEDELAVTGKPMGTVC